MTAQEEERRLIARELHDETSQALTFLIVKLKVLEDADSPTAIQQSIQDLREAVAGILDRVHDLALELRPTVLDDLGLVAALRQYLRDYQGKYRLSVDFQAMGLDRRRLPPEVETTIYRVVQEALSNVARHAQAQNASVLLEKRESFVAVVVEDDGQGFDVAEATGTDLRRSNLGLYGMQERVTLLGGTLTIESSPGVGTATFVKIPLGTGTGTDDEEDTSATG